MPGTRNTRPTGEKTMEIYVDGKQVGSLPQFTAEEKLKHAAIKLSKFWNTPLREFWKNVYINCRDEERKSRATPHCSANGNNDGNPAA